ncbi:unnamed protein product [Heligmosomoides polygyrus]|uniref:Uncharacterized protein n=1 Tax=Heligmosomoides polygyrus TaxID=6339 RepID=A0A3P8BQC9_HELPZ|nr:unnamed protein product [Heligmosomoides polygyrus]
METTREVDEGSVLLFPQRGKFLSLQISMEEKRISVLCPQSSLAHKVLVWTDVTFLDDQVTRAAQ